MPPSQLKRLKASLREQGVVGPQKSKKQKEQASKSGALRDSRIKKITALQGIREEFNPFEVKAPSKIKYEFASSKTVGGRVGKEAVSRPGVTKGLGEENVRRLKCGISSQLLTISQSVEKHCWLRCKEGKRLGASRIADLERTTLR